MVGRFHQREQTAVDEKPKGDAEAESPTRLKERMAKQGTHGIASIWAFVIAILIILFIGPALVLVIVNWSSLFGR